MGDGDPARRPDFAAELPRRFAEVLSEAHGAISGIASSSSAGGRPLVDFEAMGRLHDIFRLRVELEIEVAGLLWNTAEVVCALADASEAIVRRNREARGEETEPWLPGAAREIVTRRRARVALADTDARHRSRWPDLEQPAVVEPIGGPAPQPESLPQTHAPLPDSSQGALRLRAASDMGPEPGADAA